MSQPTVLPTQQPPTHVGAARRLLVAVLNGEDDANVRIGVADALTTLDRVWPPYPPPGLDDSLPAATGIPDALAELVKAIEEATDVQDVIRCGLASNSLRQLVREVAG